MTLCVFAVRLRLAEFLFACVALQSWVRSGELFLPPILVLSGTFKVLSVVHAGFDLRRLNERETQVQLSMEEIDNVLVQPCF